MSPKYEIPLRRVPVDDAGYFEKVSQAVFQAGFSWEVIRSKWPNFMTAFAGFDIDRVASFTDEEVEKLLEDRGIVRNGRKISATIQNAKVCQQIVDEHGSIHSYLRHLDGMDYDERAKRLIKKFKFMGPMGA